MRCAPGVDGSDGPRHVFSDECTHEFEWATALACQPKHEAIDCAVYDPDGKMYDLTRLVDPESNYETAGADGFLYVVNVCRPIGEPDVPSPPNGGSTHCPLVL